MKYTAKEVKEALEDDFGQFGKIVETIVKTKQGSSNSYAFIEFNEVSEAAEALEK